MRTIALSEFGYSSKPTLSIKFLKLKMYSYSNRHSIGLQDSKESILEKIDLSKPIS